MLTQARLMRNKAATRVPAISTEGGWGELDLASDPAHIAAGLTWGRGRPVLRDLKANSFFTMLRTWFRGELVGEDEYGNRYYRQRGRSDGGGSAWRKERRWVVFVRAADPTLVPPGWVGWLHRRFEKPPSEQPLPAPRWEKERLPNLTGTPAAYLPPGAIQRGGQRPPATGDYEAWRPE